MEDENYKLNKIERLKSDLIFIYFSRSFNFMKNAYFG